MLIVTAAAAESVPEPRLTPFRATAPLIEPESGTNVPPLMVNAWPLATTIAPLSVKLKERPVPVWLSDRPALTAIVPSLLSWAEAKAMVRGWLTVIVPAAWSSNWASR